MNREASTNAHEASLQFYQCAHARGKIKRLYIVSPESSVYTNTSECESIAFYDGDEYRIMAMDERRNVAYQVAIDAAMRSHQQQRSVSVLEIGPGAEAVLSRMLLTSAIACERMLRLIMVEGNQRSAQLASDAIKDALCNANDCEILHGFSTDERIVKQVSSENAWRPFHLFVSEILGSFLSSEGFPYIVYMARRDGLISDETRILPRFGATLVVPADYRQQSFRAGVSETLWGPRVVYGDARFDEVALASEWGVMEFYDFQTTSTKELEAQNVQTQVSEFTVNEDAELNSLLCVIWVDMGVSDLLPMTRRAHTKCRIDTKKLGSGNECSVNGTMNSATLASLLGKRKYTPSVGFTSASGTTMTAINWHRPLVLLDRPVHVLKGDTIRLVAYTRAHSLAPDYRFKVYVYRNGGIVLDLKRIVDLPYSHIRPIFSTPH